MEYSIVKTEWVENLYEPELKVQEGKVAVPTGPGWGVEINDNWLKNSEYEVSKKKN